MPLEGRLDRFDYAIIGGGLSGLQLLLAMIGDPFFDEKKIAIIEADSDPPDKTWCFWEKGTGKWEHVMDHQWSKALFRGLNFEKVYSLSPYTYKKVSLSGLRKHVEMEVEGRNHVTWFMDRILSVVPGSTTTLVGQNLRYEALHVFDSRIEEDLDNLEGARMIWQHFLGWEIKTEAPLFDPDVFTMMDFSQVWNNQTSFTYVLPFSQREALVEYTFFTPHLVDEAVYTNMLRKYLKNTYGTTPFIIERVERGAIPMTDFTFGRSDHEGLTKIGTAGGWVKPSTGYSFKNTEKRVAELIQMIKNEHSPLHINTKPRYAFFDSLFLRVLTRDNDLGPLLFSEMYLKNSIQEIFLFLDEESSVITDLKIIASLPKVPFLKALLRHLREG